MTAISLTLINCANLNYCNFYVLKFKINWCFKNFIENSIRRKLWNCTFYFFKRKIFFLSIFVKFAIFRKCWFKFRKRQNPSLFGALKNGNPLFLFLRHTFLREGYGKPPSLGNVAAADGTEFFVVLLNRKQLLQN